MKSLKELYRCGHGPSSSHTMAPFRASEIFLRRYPDAAHFEVTLFGSLAATGKGHFTDRAICSVLSDSRTRIHWKPDLFLPEHPNGMLFAAFDASSDPLGSWKVFSTGGGALSEDGNVEETPECYPFQTMNEILELCDRRGLSLWQVAEEWEALEWLSGTYEQMMRTLNEGLNREGELPGTLHLRRKAREVYRRSNLLRKELRRTGLIAAYAYALAEENASLGRVITAPTCGSSGVLPAVLHYLQEFYHCSVLEIRHALTVAGMVGNLVKQNGSISGAEVGCQGEIGTACAMAAAGAAALLGGTPRQCEYAAEMGLEHFLGLTCDPVCGFVQIPCIERNVLAANQAMIAAELALLSDGCHRVSFDDVVLTMLRTGHDLPSIYRETSQGGLAAIVPAHR